MTRALVVDDSPEDLRATGALLEEAGLAVVHATNGREALRLLAGGLPDVIVTKVGMPARNGILLVENVHRRYPSVPVVVLAARGKEPLAAAALLKGAASYVLKARLRRDLVGTVARVLEVTAEKQDEERAFEGLAETEYRFVVDHDPSRIKALVAFLRRQMARRGLGDETELMQAAVALDEALANAVHHGNLEVSSRLRDEDLGLYLDRIEERRRTAPYNQRRAHVSVRMGQDEAVFVIRDEGPGFDPSTVPDPTLPENVQRCSGRGLHLIRMLMDEVRHNDRGNEITLVKRRKG